jgi:hypothetical protein
MFEKRIAWPKYQIIAKRIKVFPFSQITTHTLHNEHKQIIRNSIEKHGFLNPPVIDMSLTCCSGNHSFKLMEDKRYTHIICYQGITDDEVKFLSRMNKIVWEKIIKGEEVRDFAFIFEDEKLSALINSCRVLLEP